MHSLVLVALLAAPPANATLERARAASGGPAWAAVQSIHLRAKLATGGLTGTMESWEDARTGRYVDSVVLGPAAESEGFDGHVVWQVDTAQQPRERGDAESKEAAADEAYRSALAYWFPERWPATIDVADATSEGTRRFDVLNITPKGGRPFTLWVDAATHLIDRTVEKGAQETTTTLFSDYRTVNGVKLPFAVRVTNGEAKYDQVVAVESLELNPALRDAQFQMPRPPPPDYAFAGGATSTTLPFALINNHIYVDVRLNGGGPFRVLLDTGGANIITPTVAKQLGLKPQGALEGHGAGDNTEDFGLLKLDSLQVGEVTLSHQLFSTFALEPFSRVEGVEESGLIGYEIFKRFVVTIDYQARRLTLTAPAAFSYAGKGTAVAFKFNDQIPQVEGAIDGVAGVFDLDTGSRASVSLLRPFVEKNALVHKYAPTVEGVTGWGVGGATRGQVVRAKLLKLGDVTIQNPVAELSLQKKGAFSDPYVAGNVGGGVFKRFTMTFDYGHQRIYFEPNGADGTADLFDRSGTWLNVAADGASFEVIDVMARGPAQQAGLKVGDRVVAVDNVPAGKLSLPELRERLKASPAGTVVKLQVKSGDAVHEIALTLRDLV